MIDHGLAVLLGLTIGIVANQAWRFWWARRRGRS